jgi:hypothetical protein
LQHDCAFRDSWSGHTSFAGILGDPLPCCPTALVGTSLVLVDRNREPSASGAHERIAHETLYPPDETFHFSFVLLQEVEKRLRAGSGYDWPEREHGIYIDYKGFVWLGGNNCPTSGLAGLKPVADDAYLKFTPDGKFVLQIGKSNQSKGDADTVNVHRAADAWVHAPTNELFVADGYGNHRVIIFDADTGAFKRMWGAFGKPPGGEDSCAIVSPKTFPDPEGPAHFNVAHAIRVANDGMVYLADRENRRVQMFTNDGKFIKQLIRTRTPFARNLALSADSHQQFLYVGADKGITVVDRKTLDVVGAIQPAGILGPGHHIATDSKGNIYLAQTTAGMQKLVFKGMPPTQ